jgi:preprotein translocase subunit Sec63
MVNYYKILGIDILSSEEDIKKTYRELARQYHPDVNSSPESANYMALLNEAYEVLSDPEKKAKYDTQFKYQIIEMPKQAEKKRKFSIHKIELTQKQKQKIVKFSLLFLAILVVGAIIFFLEWNFLQKSKADSLQIGMTVQNVYDIYGSPDKISKDTIMYGSSTIMIDNDRVVGWYNANDCIKIKNKEIENASDIAIDQSIYEIFDKYGYPDTYAKTFVVYYDIVIFYDSNNKIIEVKAI